MWFYSLPIHEAFCHPAEKLYRDYLGAVKFGNIFSLDVGPDYAGRLREVDVLSNLGMQPPGLDRYTGRYRLEAPPTVTGIMGDRAGAEGAAKSLRSRHPQYR